LNKKFLKQENLDLKI